MKSADRLPDTDGQNAAGQKYTMDLMTDNGEADIIKALEEKKDMGQYHILIVDDVPLNLAVLKSLLKRIGVRDIETAVDGLKAWEMILSSERPFDCVLTDIWMPKMDGKKLVAKIRAYDRFAGLPVYAITADIAEQKTFAEHMFTGTLLKPLTIEKLSALFR